MIRFRFTLPVLVLVPILAWPQAQDPDVFGWIEPVALPGAGISLMAKLDTGADVSSLDATNIRRVRRGEKRLVKFDLRHPETGEIMHLERPFVRSTRIRRHGGVTQRRQVVRMAICLGDHQRTVEINLIDRSNFSYPMLLGRNALEGIALVDSSVTDTSEPSCVGSGVGAGGEEP